MATVITPESIPTRPAFLDGRPKHMLINGQWVGAASGKTFENINPSPERCQSLCQAGMRDRR
jgi:aldehyde dehydrogenase (NAD+)